MTPKPRLVIISETIRRDLHRPLAYFQKFEVIHLYHRASYGDMKPEDFQKPKAIQFTSQFDLYSKIREAKPTVLQAPEPSANQLSFMASFTCWLYWFFNQPKIVVPFFENRPFHKKFGQIKFLLVVMMTRRLRRIAALLIVLNKGAEKNLLSIGVEKAKIVSLMWGSWGIDTVEFKPQGHKKKFEILFLGRVSIAKGILTLLEAYEIIKNKLPQANLTFAGPEGDASIHVKNANINYIGPVKNSDVPKLLAEATVVAMPSQTTREWMEQVGMVGLQALACGTCLVTTNSGAIPEYFKTGLGCQIVREKNPEELATALLRVLEDSTYRTQQEKKAVVFVTDNYSLKDQIKLIEDKLSTLIN